jgi:hypothetical protein
MVAAMAHPPRPARITQLDIDLHTFCGQMAEHTGLSGVEAAVRDYRANTDLARAVGSRSQAKAAVRAKLEIEFANGMGWVGGRQVRKVASGGKTRRVLRAAVVEKREPGLWEASRIRQVNLDIKSGLAVVPKVYVPPMRTMTEAWAAYEQLNKQGTEATKKAEAARDKLRALFEGVADVWPVEELYVTSDGWTLGRNELRRFNEAVCRAEAAKLNIDITTLEVEEVSPLSTRYALVGSGGEDDEIDGD